MDSMKTLVPLTLVLLLAGCGGGASEEEKAPEATALVKTATATLGATRDEVAVYGAAEAAPGGERSVVVPSEAIVAVVNAPSGTTVQAGQAILTLRASPATRIEAAKANGDAATANAAYQRALRLRKDGLVADADVETARAAMVAAQAAVTGQRVGVNGLVLRAPIAGVVQGLTAKAGDQVAAGTSVASIATRGDLRARFGVDPAVAQRIHVGEPITVSLIAGGAPITTTVNGVDPQIDATTRLASIYARIPASAGVGPGEPVRGSVTVSGSASGITIPYSALLDDGGRSYVFVVEGDTAKSRDVSPGSSSGSTVQILKGLKPGERVVTEGGTALEDDMKVREDNGAAPAKQGADK
jgi:RND family efflux transporter MFP subunit